MVACVQLKLENREDIKQVDVGIEEDYDDDTHFMGLLTKDVGSLMGFITLLDVALVPERHDSRIPLGLVDTILEGYLVE